MCNNHYLLWDLEGERSPGKEFYENYEKEMEKPSKAGRNCAAFSHHAC